MLIQKSTGNSMNYKLDCLSQADIINRTLWVTGKIKNILHEVNIYLHNLITGQKVADDWN